MLLRRGQRSDPEPEHQQRGDGAEGCAHAEHTRHATEPDQHPGQRARGRDPRGLHPAHHHIGRRQLVRRDRQRRNQRRLSRAGRGDSRGSHHRSRVSRQRHTAGDCYRGRAHRSRLHQVTPGQKNHRGTPVRQGGEHRRQQRRRRQLGQRHHAGDRGAAPAVGVDQHGNPHRILGEDEQRVPPHHPPQRAVARQRPESPKAAPPSHGDHLIPVILVTRCPVKRPRHQPARARRHGRNDCRARRAHRTPGTPLPERRIPRQNGPCRQGRAAPPARHHYAPLNPSAAARQPQPMALPRDTGVIVAGGRRWPCTGPAPTVAPATTSAIWP